MTSVVNINDEQKMKCVMKWHKLGQIFTTGIYFVSLPFLLLFCLHASIPQFEVDHLILNALFYVTCVCIAIRLIVAIFTKLNIGKWEHYTHKKLTDKEIIQLI